MQTCRIRGSICDELDWKVRRFLWAGTKIERKPHLVAWSTVIRPMLEGGLGIRPMRSLNSASMAKLEASQSPRGLKFGDTNTVKGAWVLTCSWQAVTRQIHEKESMKTN